VVVELGSDPFEEIIVKQKPGFFVQPINFVNDPSMG
jgi:hypothetical protein